MFGRFDASKPIAIIGAGVMGAKVGWACARSGLVAHVYDVKAGRAADALARALSWSQGEEESLVRKNMHPSASLAGALQGVQLAFENVPERLDLKQEVLGEIDSLLEPDAYMGSNASSITCSPLAAASGRPERFFNMNFSDPRSSRLVEIMAARQTAPETLAFARDWARFIGMTPIGMKKEQLGYSSNRLWRVIKREALRQIAEGYATAHDIDRAWMLTWGVETGPCGLMDDIGLHSVLAVEKVYFEESGDEADRPPQFLVDMVERGDVGVLSGKGFYTYPDPAYRQPDFLEGSRA